MQNFKKIDSTSNETNKTYRTVQNGFTNTEGSSYTEGNSSSAYTVRSPMTNHQSVFTTDQSSDQSRSTAARSSKQSNQRYGPKNFRLIPIKVKDLVEILNKNPAYMNKSLGIINVKENEIDQLFDEHNGSGLKSYTSPKSSFKNSLHERPISTQQSSLDESNLRQYLDQTPSPRSLVQSYNGETVPHSSDQEPRQFKPPLRADQAQQVYAMTNVQAYPMVGSANYKAPRTRRRKSPRVRSKRRISPAHRVKRRSRSRTRTRPRSRGRSRRRRSRPRKVVRVHSRRRSPPVVIFNRPRNRDCCTPLPLCDNECTTTVQSPVYTVSRPAIRHSRVSMTCDCNLCMEKLQFIQPGVCSKRKYMWTNEYAIIPKPQVNLIDPCEELDPTIYPRADNPCIRDGRGNPLTDCIGRPLRDPIGKKFLRFSGNGSVMDTNFRGNFYTGQPPLCVKCPLPGSSCAPDTTHNWWMSCGYPIQPNMDPFYKHVVATENLRRI